MYVIHLDIQGNAILSSPTPFPEPSSDSCTCRSPGGITIGDIHGRLHILRRYKVGELAGTIVVRSTSHRRKIKVCAIELKLNSGLIARAAQSLEQHLCGKGYLSARTPVARRVWWTIGRVFVVMGETKSCEAEIDGCVVGEVQGQVVTS
jgi:hypothetical protein